MAGAWAIVGLIWLFFVASIIWGIYLNNIGFFIIVGTNVEFVSMLMGVATFVLGAVTAIIAVLAFLGFTVIKKSAVDASRSAAIAAARTEVQIVAKREVWALVPSETMKALSVIQNARSAEAQDIAKAAGDDGDDGRTGGRG